MSQAPSPELIAIGVSRIHQVRRVWWLTILLGFVAVAALGGISRASAMIGAAFWVVAVVVAAVRLALVQCPQCRCEFHLTTIERLPRKCGNCGLSLEPAGRRFFW